MTLAQVAELAFLSPAAAEVRSGPYLYLVQTPSRITCPECCLQDTLLGPPWTRTRRDTTIGATRPLWGLRLLEGEIRRCVDFAGGHDAGRRHGAGGVAVQVALVADVAKGACPGTGPHRGRRWGWGGRRWGGGRWGWGGGGEGQGGAGVLVSFSFPLLSFVSRRPECPPSVKGGRGSLFPGVILYYGMSIQFHGSSYGGAAEPRVDVVTGWHACRCIRAHGMGLVEAAPATAKP